MKTFDYSCEANVVKLPLFANIIPTAEGKMDLLSKGMTQINIVTNIVTHKSKYAWLPTSNFKR